MAKKLKSLSKTELLKHLTIDEAAFAPTFTDNFLDYAMYSIESRALPDIRDGNKPVHRRILYDMGINKNTSKNPYVKVARRVGSVIGLWHPHGDSSVEAAYHPADTEYLFFVTKGGGEHFFSKTYKEHLDFQKNK